MFVIYFFAVVLILTVTCFLIGNYFASKKVFTEINVDRIGLGYLIIMGIFSVISIPFMFFHTKFSWLYWSILLLIIILLLVSVKFFLSSQGLPLRSLLRGGLLKSFKNKSNIMNEFHFILNPRDKIRYICLLLIFLQMILFIILKSKNDDDGWYVAITSTALEYNEIFSRDPATGSELFSFMSHYELVGHELFLAIVCRLFVINPAVLCHTVIPIFYILIHYVIVYDLCKKMDKENTDKFFLCFVILNIFSGYSRFSRGAFLIRRIWCGKALIANISLPMLLLLWWNIYEKKQVKKGDIILLTLVTYYTFQLSAIGLYMVPLAYMVYTIVFFLYTRKWIETIKLCLPMIFALPYVFLKWIMITSENLALVTQNADELSWLSVLEKLSGNNTYIWVMWGIAIIIIFMMGKSVMKYLLSVYPVLCFVTFLNPYLCSFVAGNITGTSVYWRLIWNLQMSFTFLGAFVCIFRSWKWNRAFLMIPYLLLMIICGNVIYIKEKFPLAENYENLAPTTLNLADFMVKSNYLKGGIMIPFPYFYEVRQYTGKIEIIWTEYEIHHYTLEAFEQLSLLYDKLYVEKEYSTDIIDELREFNVTYLGLYTTIDNSEFSQKYNCIYKDEELMVYDIASLIE